jgi:hypothetical protein
MGFLGWFITIIFLLFVFSLLVALIAWAVNDLSKILGGRKDG